MHANRHVSDLLIACPSLASRLDLNEGENYVMSRVGFLLRDGELNADDERCVYDYLNRLAHDDIEGRNLLVVNVLEILTDTPRAVTRARASLTGHAIFLFERVLRGWNFSKR